MKTARKRTHKPANLDRSLRLNLGCGRRHVEGYVNVDLLPTADVACDLNEDFPFDDGSASEVLAMHVIEHLRDGVHFLNECWRVLRPGGTMHLETPCPTCEWYWSDPTHVRGYSAAMFLNFCQPSRAQETTDYDLKMWSSVRAITVEDANYPPRYALTVSVDMVK